MMNTTDASYKMYFSIYKIRPHLHKFNVRQNYTIGSEESVPLGIRKKAVRGVRAKQTYNEDTAKVLSGAIRPWVVAHFVVKHQALLLRFMYFSICIFQ